MEKSYKIFTIIVFGCFFLIVTSGLCDELINHRSFKVPQHGKLILKVPTQWQQEIKPSIDDRPPTFIFSPQNDDEFKILITPFWSPNNNPNFNKDVAVRQYIDDELKEFMLRAVETQVSINEIKGIDTTGYYFLVTDKAPKPGEYPYAVRAKIGVGNLLLHVTILCREKNSKSISHIIQTLQTAHQENS